jgi:RES domain-containing protein
MKVFRLCKAKFSGDLSGKGAELFGGRWNNKGVALLYTSDSVSLCTLEVLVHSENGELPRNYVLHTLEIPDELPIYEFPMDKIPADWQTFPHSEAARRIGDQFVKEGKYAVLKVPSAIVPNDFNYLLNPGHVDFSKIKITNTEDYEFDIRLFV